MVQRTMRNVATEWAYHATRPYRDPFNEVTLHVWVTCPDGKELEVPAFWSGDDLWRWRFASTQVGVHRYRTVCSNADDAGLHGQEGVLEVVPYEGTNPLLQHGPLRVAEGGRYLEHRDGSPFCWLGDTWWMGLCKRLTYPEEFEVLAADRAGKGFSVIQIVAGLYPDMAPFDPRGANEAGFPWTTDFARINPSYFDLADRRIESLINHGLLPCLVGCWGFFLPRMGVETMRRHWRYLIARYGAYPVVWCLAGEGIMPYYLSTDRAGDTAMQKRGWSELAGYVRGADPYHHPLTIHPYEVASLELDDPARIDFDMLQPGHEDRASIAPALRGVAEGRARLPRMPVVVAEVCYEGILEACRQELQRFLFWTCMLGGAAGYTYGANGLWQLNGRDQPYGSEPHGGCWGDTPWEDAYRLPGSLQVGLAKQLLARFEWWRFEPHPEWVEPHASAANYMLPHAAGIPGEIRMMYVPGAVMWPVLKGLEPGVKYHAVLWNPTNGVERVVGTVAGDAQGDWRSPQARLPIAQDWVLVLRRQGESR